MTTKPSGFNVNSYQIKHNLQIAQSRRRSVMWKHKLGKNCIATRLIATAFLSPYFILPSVMGAEYIMHWFLGFTTGGHCRPVQAPTQKKQQDIRSFHYLYVYIYNKRRAGEVIVHRIPSAEIQITPAHPPTPLSSELLGAQLRLLQPFPWALHRHLRGPVLHCNNRDPLLSPPAPPNPTRHMAMEHTCHCSSNAESCFKSIPTVLKGQTRWRLRQPVFKIK